MEYGDSDEAPQRPVFRPRRESVFVEAVQVDDKWIPPSYPHTAEETGRLRGYISNSIMLSQLSIQSRDIVINALERKEFPAGTEIITQA
jgi:hypothetical protein